MSKYTDIMKYLNPRNIIEKTEVPNDTARGKYSLTCSIAKSYPEYEKIIIDYMDFHYKEVYNGASFPPDMLLEKAEQYLKKWQGLRNFAYVALSGANGGIPYILNLISEAIKEEMKKAYFRYVLNTYVNPLSFPELVELMQEFKSKLINYSPPSFAFITPEEMANEYDDILWDYIESLTKYKNIWKF